MRGNGCEQCSRKSSVEASNIHSLSALVIKHSRVYSPNRSFSVDNKIPMEPDLGFGQNVLAKS